VQFLSSVCVERADSPDLGWHRNPLSV